MGFVDQNIEETSYRIFRDVALFYEYSFLNKCDY